MSFTKRDHEAQDRKRKTKKNLYCPADREWGVSIRSFKEEEFEIIKSLHNLYSYDVLDLCELMNVSRSGYYKWLKKPDNQRKVKRETLIETVEEVHKAHPSHGYRWTAAYIRINYGYEFSDNFIFKIFHYLGIKAQSKHQRKSKPRKIKDKYPNLIYSTWETVDRPRQVIVSDMTSFCKCQSKYVVLWR